MRILVPCTSNECPTATLPGEGRARLALQALTTRALETTGRSAARNLDLALWHGDSGKFEGEAASVARAGAVWGPLIVEALAR